MPSEGIANIYITAKDDASQVFSLVGGQVKALDKETQMLRQHTEALNKANQGLLDTQAELERQLISAKKATADARKEFKKPGEIADLSIAIERLSGYRRNTIEAVKNV